MKTEKEYVPEEYVPSMYLKTNQQILPNLKNTEKKKS